MIEILSGSEFKVQAYYYELTESSDLFYELMDYIDSLNTLKECDEIKDAVPGGMLLFRFGEKLKELKN
jgi:hypothetical protein